MRARPSPIRVMVVDDSAVVRGLWARLVDAEPDMRVVASAWNGQAALDVLGRKPVDVVLLDIEMPEMDGLTALPLILRRHPAVRVVMASSLTERGAEATIRALSLGAADYVAKPATSGVGSAMQAAGAELVRKIRALAPLGPPSAAPFSGPAAGHPFETPAPSWGASLPDRAEPPQAVAITSSTGGPNALTAVLSALPADFPLPILVVQHMPPLFTTMLADRLDRETPLACREGTDGELVRPGCVFIAPGDRHMVVEEGARGATIRLTDAPPENFCRPSADPLFRSMAAQYGPAMLAVVLTGMGQDGLAGARSVREAGAPVVVQDEGTSVVWGMPGAVARAGLASAVLPLPHISRHIDQQTRTRK